MPKEKKTKFIFVSGGVISGLGKGITTASLAVILQSKGYVVTCIKADMYLNVDAGTIRPQEHGEVFVLNDGTECDQDLGNYERFIDQNLSAANYITTGQIYKKIIERERNFEYDGEDVEAIPHVCEEIIHRIKEAGRKTHAEFVIVEFGGTVGEYQNVLFFEASRIMKLKHHEDVVHVHVGYLPIPANLGELKSKPIQMSVQALNSMGIQPDFIVGRAERWIDQKRRDRLALFCNVEPDHVIANPDVDTIYKIPILLEKQKFSEKILAKFDLPTKNKDLKPWRELLVKIKNAKNEIKIGLVGKYFATGDYVLSDVYISVIEAIKHASWHENVKPKLVWIDSEKIEKGEDDQLKEIDALVVPGGFGSRGTEGIISAIHYARKNKLPFLGLCFGLQMATIEFARSVAKLSDANTTEVDSKTKYPVIDIMPDQLKKIMGKEYGGTMRLGAYPCKIKMGTLAHQLYHQNNISERHRHRYEFNNQFREQLEKHGLIISGASPNGKLVEMIEIADHPYFIASQFHPEFQSHPHRPHPLFLGLIKAAKK